MPRFTGGNLAYNLRLVAQFDALAAEAGATPAQLAIAWNLSRGDHVIPIPGTGSIAHLEENMGGLAVPMTADLAARIDAIFPPGALRGPRYPALMQSQVTTEIFPDEELA